MLPTCYQHTNTHVAEERFCCNRLHLSLATFAPHWQKADRLRDLKFERISDLFSATTWAKAAKVHHQESPVWKPETRQPPVVTQRLEALFGTHLQRLVCGFCWLWRCRVCFLLQPNAQITPAPIWKRLKQLRRGNCVSQNLNTQNLAKKRQKPQPPTLAQRFCL